jgi:hypothetical protein
VSFEVAEGDRQGGPDQPPAVDVASQLAAQLESCLFEVEQLLGREVDGHLLVVLDASAQGLRRRPRIGRCGGVLSGRSGAEELVRTRQIHAPGHRLNTSRAS